LIKNGLARLQDEPREDQPDDYEDRKPDEYASEHGAQLPVVSLFTSFQSKTFEPHRRSSPLAAAPGKSTCAAWM
jgi:hypothetical protein